MKQSFTKANTAIVFQGSYISNFISYHYPPEFWKVIFYKLRTIVFTFWKLVLESETTSSFVDAQQVFSNVKIWQISSQISNLSLTSPSSNTFIIYLHAYLLPSFLCLYYPSCYATALNLSYRLDCTPLLVSLINFLFGMLAFFSNTIIGRNVIYVL